MIFFHFKCFAKKNFPYPKTLIPKIILTTVLDPKYFLETIFVWTQHFFWSPIFVKKTNIFFFGKHIYNNQKKWSNFFDPKFLSTQFYFTQACFIHWVVADYCDNGHIKKICMANNTVFIKMGKTKTGHLKYMTIKYFESCRKMKNSIWHSSVALLSLAGFQLLYITICSPPW